MIDDDFFCTETPVLRHRGRQLRQRQVDAVLHLHLRDVGIGVEREVDGQRRAGRWPSWSTTCRACCRRR